MLNGSTVVLDIGANTDNRPEHLLQFGIMGSIYAEVFLERSDPRVALLSTGEEEGKGIQGGIRKLKYRKCKRYKLSKDNLITEKRSSGRLVGKSMGREIRRPC